MKCKLPVHEPTQGRTPLSARVTGAGIRFFVPGRADCRVASRREASALGVLLGMTVVGFIDTLKGEGAALSLSFVHLSKDGFMK